MRIFHVYFRYIVAIRLANDRVAAAKVTYISYNQNPSFVHRTYNIVYRLLFRRFLISMHFSWILQKV